MQSLGWFGILATVYLQVLFVFERYELHCLSFFCLKYFFLPQRSDCSRYLRFDGCKCIHTLEWLCYRNRSILAHGIMERLATFYLISRQWTTSHKISITAINLSMRYRQLVRWLVLEWVYTCNCCNSVMYYSYCYSGRKSSKLQK